MMSDNYQTWTVTGSRLITDTLPIVCVVSHHLGPPELPPMPDFVLSLNPEQWNMREREVSAAVRYWEMNVKHLPLLSLCVFPQLTEPVMVFRTRFWRGTSLIRCFLIIWAQTMRAKVRFAYLLIGYTNNHYHVTNIVLIIVMIRLSVFEEGSFFFSFHLEKHVSTYEVS